MMNSGHNRWGVDRTGKERTDTEWNGDQELHAFQYSIFQQREDRAKNSQSYVSCHKDRHKRSYK